MTDHDAETPLVAVLEALDRVRTGEDIVHWARDEMRRVVPHSAFIGGIWRVHRTSVSPVKLFGANFSREDLETLKRADGHPYALALKDCLASGEVLFLAGENLVGGSTASPTAKAANSSRPDAVAMYGLYDLSRQYASCFSLHRIPSAQSETHRRWLKVLTPAMHVAMQRIIHQLKDNARTSRADRTLTARELEVLEWVGEGKTSAEIAAILGVARSTVRNQIQTAMVKLRVNSRTQAVAKAIKKGLMVNRQPDSQFGGLS